MTQEIGDEIQQMTGGVYYKVESDNCFGCANCAEACPEAAIRDAASIARIQMESCTGCGSCAPVCPMQ